MELKKHRSYFETQINPFVRGLNPQTTHDTEGYTRIIERGQMEMACFELGILNLNAGGSFFENTADNAVALIVLGGRCELLVGHNGNKAHGIIGELLFGGSTPERTVFRGGAYRAYIPCRTTYEILAHDAPVEVAICKVPSYLEMAAVILEPGDNLGDSRYGLVVGETPIQSISTSSIRRISGEAICFYRFDPSEGYVYQRISSNDGSCDQTVKMGHNDVLALPEGYHAVSLESKGRLYCLWIAFAEEE
jgi:5-deoxy-D-glucuronate isomerase